MWIINWHKYSLGQIPSKSNTFSPHSFMTLSSTDTYYVFAVLSIHLAFWQNQNSGIMGFQGFAYTSGTIFQLSFCSERFLFLERWKIWKKTPKKLLIFFSRTILFLGMYRDWIWKQKERNTTKMLAFNLVKSSNKICFW